jgi:hypothetical protein
MRADVVLLFRKVNLAEIKIGCALRVTASDNAINDHV